MTQDYWDQIILEQARTDGEYQQLLARCIEAEAAYRAILESLPPAQQAQLEHYISLCEELEHRKTVLACRIPRT